MKKVKQLNNMIIKEKRDDEVLKNIDLNRRYTVFSSDGKTWLEDNLTYDEAIQFCSGVDEQNLKNIYFTRGKIYCIRAYMDATRIGLSKSLNEVNKMINKWEQERLAEFKQEKV